MPRLYNTMISVSSHSYCTWLRDIWDKVEETVDITQPLLVFSWGNEVVSRNVGYGFHRVTITEITDILYL